MSSISYYKRDIDGKVIYGWKLNGKWLIGPFINAEIVRPDAAGGQSERMES